jgi:hypothetical protein
MRDRRTDDASTALGLITSGFLGALIGAAFLLIGYIAGLMLVLATLLVWRRFGTTSALATVLGAGIAVLAIFLSASGGCVGLPRKRVGHATFSAVRVS